MTWHGYQRAIIDRATVIESISLGYASRRTDTIMQLPQPIIVMIHQLPLDAV